MLQAVIAGFFSIVVAIVLVPKHEAGTKEFLLAVLVVLAGVSGFLARDITNSVTGLVRLKAWLAAPYANETNAKKLIIAGGVPAYLSALAALGAVIIATFAYSSWRQQEVEKRRAEAVRDVLRSTHAFHNCLGTMDDLVEYTAELHADRVKAEQKFKEAVKTVAGACLVELSDLQMQMRFAGRIISLRASEKVRDIIEAHFQYSFAYWELAEIVSGRHGGAEVEKEEVMTRRLEEVGGRDRRKPPPASEEELERLHARADARKIHETTRLKIDEFDREFGPLMLLRGE